MTEKRFGMIKTDTYELYVPVDEKKVYIFPSFEDELDCMRFVNALNDLEEKHRENGKIASNFLKENERLKQRITELELLNDGLNYALKNIKKIDVEIDVGDYE